jgi:hypothetical protein
MGSIAFTAWWIPFISGEDSDSLREHQKKNLVAALTSSARIFGLFLLVTVVICPVRPHFWPIIDGHPTILPRPPSILAYICGSVQ